MPDLHAAIRERLDLRPTFGVAALATGTVAPNAARWINVANAAIEAVLKLHRPEDSEYTDADGQSRTSTDCDTCDTGGVPDGWPCPTVLAIADKLGIPTGGNDG